jgi:hypothetical protein
MLRDEALKKQVMDEAHKSRYSIHQGEVSESIGTTLKFSTLVHSQTDGQSEWVIQILEHIFRVCVLDFL